MAKGTDNHSTLGLASRHALDATRVDDQGRKALHRFSASYNVIEVHPEAAKEVDHRGWLPLNHYCRGLGGDYDDFGDDVERHLGTLEERRAAPFVGDGSRPRDRPGDPKFFETCESLADVRKEYKAMLLTYHPDKNIGDEDEACRQMQRLQDAYAVALKKFHKKRPLEEAVASGDVAQVLASVGGLGGEDVRDFVDAEGNTLLHLVCTRASATWRGPARAVVRLNPEALKDQNQEGDTPLHCLCACHRSPTEFEALRFAGRRSVGALEKLLAAFPAGAAHADAFDWTPLHLFAQFQIDPSLEGLNAVLAACRRRARTTIVDNDTPLHLACYAHRRKISAGAALTLGTLASFAPAAALRSCKQGRKPWDHLPSDDPNYGAATGAIFRAVVGGLDEVCLEPEEELRRRSFLEKVLRNFRDSSGGSLLHVLAGAEGAEVPLEDVLRVADVLGGGAAVYDDADADGRTPLHRACAAPAARRRLRRRRRRPVAAALVAALLEASPGAAARADRGGKTPLHLAASLCDDDAAAVFKHAPILKEPTGDGKYDIKWAALDALLDAGRAPSAAASAGDSPLHLAAHAFRKSISPAAPHLLDVLVSAAPDSAARAVRQRGKASKTPLEWLPRGDARYGLCEELLSHKVARCLELLLEHHGDAASHVLPETGELALHQVCAITPPVATVRMLVALLANHAPAAATPRKSDGKTPLHLLCRAVTVDRDHYVPPPRADGGDGDDDERGLRGGLRRRGRPRRRLAPRPRRARLIRALLEYAPEAADAKDGDGKLALDYLPRQDRKYDACAALFAVFSAFARHPHLRVAEDEAEDVAADDAPPSPPSSSPPSSSPTTPTRSRRDTGVEYRRTPSKPKGPSVIIVGTLQGIPEKSPSRRRSSVQIVGKVKGRAGQG
ncbi:hypothetical protein JL722_9757 [Aureococcus anophagefferens]|nr:hypothetical protein JL722_9757 [Aureococcus anophagefferens]